MLIALAAALALNAAGEWTVDDVVLQITASQFDVAPDGRTAVCVRSAPDPEEREFREKLWLVDLETGASRPLTQGTAKESAPRFAPDGRRIAFLTARADDDEDEHAGAEEPKTQVWVLRMDGGEATAATDFSEGVAGARWIDAETLLVAARERLERDEAAKDEGGDASEAVEDLGRFRAGGARFFTIDVSSDGGAPRRVGAALARSAGGIEDFEVAPGGRHAVALHAQSPSFEADGRTPPRALLWDLGEGTARELFGGRKSKPFAFSWSPDGATLYAAANDPTVDGEDMAGITVLFAVDVATAAEQRVDLDWERGLTVPEVVPVAGGFVARLADGARPAIARYARSAAGAWHGERLAGAHAAHVQSFVARPETNRCVYFTSTASEPGRWYAATLRDALLEDPVPLEDLSSEFAGKTFAKSEVIQFAGAGGDSVEAILFHPHAAAAEGRHPLILMTHGGPFGADYDQFTDSWAYAPNLYCERGAYVLAVNYHGSSDYGRAFAESIRGRVYELELEDLCRGIAHVAEREPIDLDRLGAIGWSNGAILSVALCTTLERFAPGFDYRFRVCVNGAGDVNWTSDYGPCAFGAAYDDYYMGGPPWQLAERYVGKSPLFHAERCRTPTLTLFGSEDTAVPTHQGWEWHRALARVGSAESRFVLFPGEPHSLEQLMHQRRKLEEELAFVERHLFGRDRAAAPAALVEGSRLWTALAAREFARVDGALGERVNDVLVPETVAVGLIRVGRFEVTREQWRQFRPETPVGLADRNLPIAGVTFAEAEEYARWLARATGAPFRLPTDEEFEELAEAAGDDENTLDSWAGFAPRPEDAEDLLAWTSERLGGGAPLLLPVGSRPPATFGAPGRKVAVFDLGGNAAEWIANGSPAGKPAGGAAAVASDPFEADPPIPPAYIGLRVVR